jgi:hypothetical protein
LNFRPPFFLLLGFFSCYAVAQEKVPNWYEVEVVVLMAENPVADDVEGFVGDPGEPQAERIVHLVSDDRTIADSLSLGALPTPYSTIAPLEQKMTETVKRLERGRNFKPLLHWAWRQPGLDREEAAAVRIDSDAAELLRFAQTDLQAADAVPEIASGDDQITAEAIETEHAATEAVANLLASPRAVESELPRVSGLLTMSANRFLHVELDMLLAIVDPYWGGGAGDSATASGFHGELRPTRTYRLQQRRRVRRDEVHYFDHPRFGVLIQVRGLDTKTESAE